MTSRLPILSIIFNVDVSIRQVAATYKDWCTLIQSLESTLDIRDCICVLRTRAAAAAGGMSQEAESVPDLSLEELESRSRGSGDDGADGLDFLDELLGISSRIPTDFSGSHAQVPSHASWIR